MPTDPTPLGRDPASSDPGGPTAAPGTALAGDAEALIAGGHQAPVAVGALLVGSALLRVGVVASAFAVGQLLSDLGGGRPNQLAIGIVIGGQALSEMLWAPVFARFADRFGRKRFLVGGPLIGMLCALLVGFASDPLQIGLVRLLEGMAAAAFVPTALGLMAAATSHNRDDRAQASGAFEASTLVGYAFGFPVGGLSYHYLHRQAFFLMAALYLAASLVCWRFVPRVPPMRVSPIRTVLAAVMGRGPVRVFLPAWISVNALTAAFYTQVPLLLHRHPERGARHQNLILGVDPRVASGVMLIWVVVIVVGIVLWTPTLRRLGPTRTMRMAVPGALVLCGALFAVNHLGVRPAVAITPVLVLGTIWLAGFGPAALTYLTDSSERLAADRSALMAFYTLSLAAGGLLGALLGGLVTKWLLFDGLILLGIVLIAIAWVALGWVMEWERSGRGVEPVGDVAVDGALG